MGESVELVEGEGEGVGEGFDGDCFALEFFSFLFFRRVSRSRVYITKFFQKTKGSGRL